MKLIHGYQYSEKIQKRIQEHTFQTFTHTRSCLQQKTGSHLLPLIPEPVTAPATVRHAVNIVHKITQKVDPGQISAITGDQPVYAIGKQLQWMSTTEFKDIVWIL